jgi:3-methyl-2-oxobutanoate hydroxymethyltransferase
MTKKITLTTLQKKQKAGEKIIVLTAHNYVFAKILAESPVSMILVGDSLAMTALGYDSTLKVTMDDMCRATEAVTRGAGQKFIVADMPFLSYQASIKQAVQNAGKLLQAGAQAVKLEGAAHLEAVSAIRAAGIPVLGHLGFTPQSLHLLGGYRVQARDDQAVQKLHEQALALEDKGVFGIVFELIPNQAVPEIIRNLSCITIGIGAGPALDGQVLVTDDLLGIFSDLHPKFVKPYLNLRKDIGTAVENFCQEVETGKFPGPEHSY